VDQSDRPALDVLELHVEGVHSDDSHEETVALTIVWRRSA
jgi:hypothetical protein